MDLTNLRDINVLLARHGFRFSKTMGQNFLVQDWVPREIVAGAGVDATCGVLEIGPGIGALTQPLSRSAGKVLAVELDRDLFPLLGETLADCDNVRIVQGDALKLDLRALALEEFQGLTPCVCANLPYNITSPVITALLEARCFRRITVMIQKEVAQRLCAAPGTAAYGAISLFVQYHARPELLFDVPPDCFVPQPKVTSSVLRLEVLDEPPVTVADEAFLFQVIRASFAQRRKTLINGLTSAFGSRLDKATLASLLSDCGFPADIRGERLSLQDFALLSQRLSQLLNG